VTRKIQPASGTPPTDSASPAYIPHIGWLHHDRGEEVINLLRQGYFEAAEQAFFWLYLRPGDTFIDCGAHIGLYSVLAAKATNGKIRVVAIEPNAHTATHLISNLKQNKVTDATTIQAAVWRTLGRIRFLTGEIGKAAYDHVAFDTAETNGQIVSTLTLNKLIADTGGKTVALVKIDVEGSETEALIGAEDAIAAGLLPVLMIEFTESNLQRRGLNTDHLYKQVAALGYTLCEFRSEQLQVVPFQPDGPIWYKNLFACADLDYVNKRLAAASKPHQKIAADIIGRAAACTRFKELENLDYFKQLAEQAPDLRHRVEQLSELNTDIRRWAEESDATVVKERALSQELREWAERIEGQLTTVREDAQKLRQDALQSAVELNAQLDTVRDLGNKLRQVEDAFAVQEAALRQLRVMAEQSDAQLAAERENSKNLHGQLSQLQSALTAQEEASRQLRVMAEQSDAQLAAERENSKNLHAQLSQLQRALTAQVEASRQLRAQAERLDSQLVVERENSKNLRGQLSQVQSALTAQEEASRQLRVMAERLDVQLAAERERSKDLHNQLRQVQSALTAQEEASRQLRVMAERLDVQVVAETKHSAKLQEWAKRSDEMLLTERETSGQLRGWAERIDTLLAMERLDNAHLKSILNSRKALLKRLILWKPFLPGWCQSKVDMLSRFAYWPIKQPASFKSLSISFRQKLSDGGRPSPTLPRQTTCHSPEAPCQQKYLNKPTSTLRHASQRDLPQHLSELEHAFRTDPSDMFIALQLGMAYEKTGNRQRALQLLQRVAKSGYEERALAEQWVTAVNEPKK
jgi:FkbM family methyltransferase